MKPLPNTLRRPVTTKVEAICFIAELVANSLDWHFDDCAVDCLHETNARLCLEDAELMNKQRDRLYDFEWSEEEGGCPIGYVLKVRGYF